MSTKQAKPAVVKTTRPQKGHEIKPIKTTSQIMGGCTTKRGK
jgi:hypothetical protein